MGLTAAIATWAGDLWVSAKSLALWPWPAVVIGMPHVKFTWNDYRAFTRYLRPGDLICTTSKNYKISNRLIGAASVSDIARNKGTCLKHLAVYTGAVMGYRDAPSHTIRKPRTLGVNYEHSGNATPDVIERTVCHAVSEGVVCQDLGELLFHADWVAAFRPHRNRTDQYAIVQAALRQVGVEYNFDVKHDETKFKPEGPQALYCTQLGVYCLKRAGIEVPKPGRMISSLWGLFLPFKCFTSEVTLADSFVIYGPSVVSLSCNDPKFPRSSKIAGVMRQAFLDAPDASTGEVNG